MHNFDFGPFTVALGTDCLRPCVTTVLQQAFADQNFMKAVREAERQLQRDVAWSRWERSWVGAPGPFELAPVDREGCEEGGTKAHFIATIYAIWAAAEQSEVAAIGSRNQTLPSLKSIILQELLEMGAQYLRTLERDERPLKLCYGTVERLMSLAHLLGNLDRVTELPRELRNMKASRGRSGNTKRVRERRKELLPELEIILHESPGASPADIFRALQKRAPERFPQFAAVHDGSRCQSHSRRPATLSYPQGIFGNLIMMLQQPN